MPVFHLLVPENPFLIKKDNFTFVKVMSKESLEYVELQDVPLNHELDPLTMMNLRFAVFKDLDPTPNLQSQFPFRAFRPKGDRDEGYEFIPVPLIFQTKALHPLSLQEASMASRLITPFQVQPCETTARYMVNSWSYQYETLGQAYEGARWAFPSETYEDTEPVHTHYQGFEIICHSPHLTPTLSHYRMELSLEPNWLLCDIRNRASWENRKELDAPYQHLWNKAFDSHYHKLSRNILTPEFRRQRRIQQLIRNATSQDELDMVYAGLAGGRDLQK